ncbi:hypothetical protein G6F31_021759 [Rhizopus arrhizus]|nr:hypothetical protein G6F31_021759 [Rhizopus arrhizus]
MRARLSQRRRNTTKRAALRAALGNRGAAPQGRAPCQANQARALSTASPMPAVPTFVVPGSKMSAVRKPSASTRRTAASMRSACGARFSE